MTVEPGIEISPQSFDRPALNSNQAGGIEAFRFVDLLRMLRVRRFLILGTAAMAMALAAVYVFTTIPTYTASAVVMLDQRKNNITDLSAVLSGLSGDSTVMPNQSEIITSRAVAARVVSHLNLDKDKEFNSDLVPPTSLYWLNPRHWPEALSSHQLKGKGSDEDESVQDAVIDSFLEDLSAEPVQSATAITIKFTSEDPAKAARIANAIAAAYVEDELNTKFDAAQKTAQWLGARLTQLSGQVSAADSAVQQYRIENNLTAISSAGASFNTNSAPNSVADQQVSGITAQLVTAKADLAEKEAQYGRVTQLANSGRAEDVSAVVQSPLIATLRGQEADLLRQEADLASVFGARHPKMVDLESQKKNLQAKIAEEVRRVVETVKSDVLVARARVASLEGSLGQTSTVSQGQSRLMAHLAELEATATTTRTLYQAVLSHYNDALSQTGIQTPDTRVLSSAVVPDEPSSPRKGRDLGIAAVIGILFGLAFAFAAERLDVGFRTAAQVEGAFGIPVLAAIPTAPNRQTGADLVDNIVDHPTSAFTEAIRGINLGLKLSNSANRPQVITVTSAVPDEGKTTVAASLARLAAIDGRRVLLIDADLRKPAVAQSFRLPNSTTSLVEALLSGGARDDLTQQDPRSNMRVLAGAQKAANALDARHLPAMQEVFVRLKAHFDLIVIDSAPLLPVHDSWLLAQMSDSVLLTVRWEKTPREAVTRAVQILQSMNAHIAGIAMTQVDVRSYYQYSYGYQSYKSYEKYYNTA